MRAQVTSLETGEVEWSDEQAAPAGRSHMAFVVDGGRLDSGRHRIELIVGDDEIVADRDFTLQAG